MKKNTLLSLISIGTSAYALMENKEAVKKMSYIAAGLALTGKEKIEELTKDMFENSKITEEEGKKMIEEIMSKSKEAKEEFEQKIEEISHKVLEKMNIATTDDIQRLEKQIEKLSKKINQQ